MLQDGTAILPGISEICACGAIFPADNLGTFFPNHPSAQAQATRYPQLAAGRQRKTSSCHYLGIKTDD
jgi:hypothetical protein